MLRRSLPAAAVFFVAGGCAGAKEERALSSVERVEISRDEEEGGSSSRWRVRSRLLKEELTTARRSPAVVSIDGRPALIGGCSAPGAHEDTMEQWRDGRFVPIDNCADTVARSCAAYCTTKSGRSFVIGGFDGLECLREVAMFEEGGVEKKEKEMPSFPTRLKNGAACALRASGGGGQGEGDVTSSQTDDVIVVAGGWDEHSTLRTVYGFHSGGHSSSSSSLISSSPSPPEMVALLPRPLEAHVLVAVDDCTAFVLGGYDGVAVTDEISMIRLLPSEVDDGDVLPRFEVRVVADCRLCEPRENHTAVYVEEMDAIIVAGGWDGRTALASVEVFRVLREGEGEGERVCGLERVQSEGALVLPRIRPVAFRE